MWQSNPLNSRQQGRGRDTEGNSFAGGCQVIQHVPFLLAQGYDCCQDALDKQASVFTLGTITAATPDYITAQSPFAGIIGGFNAFPIDKSPQSLLNFENILAGAAGLVVSQQCADLEQVDDFQSDRLHHSLEIGPGEYSVTETMPETKKLLEAGQQHSSYDLRFTPTLYPSLEIAFEMRPTHLAMKGIQAVISAVAIRTDDARKVFAQQCCCPTGTPILEDAEHGHTRSSTHPHPKVLRQLVPTCFIHVDCALRLNVFLSFLNRWLQRLTDPLFLG